MPLPVSRPSPIVPPVNATPAPRASLAWLTLAYLATRIPFVHHGGFPDGDQQHIALGILEAIQSGRFFHGLRLYGPSFSFGYHAFHFALAPLYRADPFAIFTVMNVSGVVAGLVALVSLHALVRELRGPAEADAAAILWTFAPGWWELTTFGHPSTIALALFLASAAFLAHDRRVPATLLYLAALTVRADFLLGAPFLLALPFARGSRRFVPNAIVIACAGALFLAFSRALFPPAHGDGSVAHALGVADPGLRVAVKEVVVLTLGLGVPTGIAALAGVVQARGYALVLAASIVPALAYWLEVEGPFRHFLVPASLLALLAAVWASRFARPWLVALGLVAMGQVAAFALRPQLEVRYPFTYRAVPGDARWSTRAPLGDFFTSHAAAATGVAREAADARWIADSAPDSLLVLGPNPFRAEFELRARFGERARYDVVDIPSSGVERTILSTPAGLRTFLSGDPVPPAAALASLRARDAIAARNVFVPAAAVPTSVVYPDSGLAPVRPTR